MCIEHSFALWRKTVFWVLSKPEIVFFRNWNSKLWQTYRNNLLHKQLQLYHPFCIFRVNIAKRHRTYIFFHDATNICFEFSGFSLILQCDRFINKYSITNMYYFGHWPNSLLKFWLLSSARPQKIVLNIYFLCHFTLVKAGSKKEFSRPTASKRLF